MPTKRKPTKRKPTTPASEPAGALAPTTASDDTTPASGSHPVHQFPAAGARVHWATMFGEWRSGVFVGLAPGDSGGPGDPFVAVDAPNGRVHLRLSAISW